MPAESLIKLRKNCFVYNLLRILWQKLMQTSLNIFSLFIMPNLIFYSACHEQNVLLTFPVFQQSCTSGLWLSSQHITSYPLNILLNLFWSCFLSDVALLSIIDWWYFQSSPLSLSDIGISVTQSTWNKEETVSHFSILQNNLHEQGSPF